MSVAVEMRLASRLPLRRQLREVETLLDAVGEERLAANPELGAIAVSLHAAFVEVARGLTRAEFSRYARLAEKRQL